MSRTVTSSRPVDPAVYAQALADVVALRPYGTYRAKPEKLPPTDDPRCGTRTGYNAHRHRGERACAPCLDANNTATKRRKAQQQTGTGERRGRPPAEHEHGTPGRYDQGCRCDTCKAAETARHREWRARVKGDPDAAERAGHGKASTYRNYGCRCRPCTDAHTAQLAARRAARKASA